MNAPSTTSLKQSLLQLDAQDPQYATRFVDLLLGAAREQGITDVHFQPTESELEVLWRRDGVLQSMGRFPPGERTDIVTRLKVLADLLTYRRDLPQEGRVKNRSSGEQRVSTFPTLHGERAVVRIFSEQRQFRVLQDLRLPAELQQAWQTQLLETSGLLLVSGPAGSGKTTTLYASLRELVKHPDNPGVHRDRSIVSLEDPVEVVVPGVAQAPIDAASGFDYACALRSVMRQDPEVIMIGEVRDQPTAVAAYTASLTGHLVVTSFHAGRATEALSRLADMGIEPYMLRSGTRAILCQRLVRQLCECKQPTREADRLLGLPLSQAFLPAGCSACDGTGYQGRIPLAELLTMVAGEFARQVLARADTNELERHAREAGMKTCWEHAVEMVRAGITSPGEVRRVLGFHSVPRTGDSEISR
jgi:general secretion pathway protein E